MLIENKAPNLSNALYNCLNWANGAPENIEWRLFCGVFCRIANGFSYRARFVLLRGESLRLGSS